MCVCVVESVAKESKPQYFPHQSCCFISGSQKECDVGELDEGAREGRPDELS